MTHQLVTKQGKRFVLVPLAEWRRVERLTSNAAMPAESAPPFPKPDQEGHVPALAYIQVSIARDIVRERTALGLSQHQLAKLAGIRNETLCRLESGKHSPTVRTVEKIERALQKAARRVALEDAADVRAARRALKDKSPAVPLAEVKARLGMK